MQALTLLPLRSDGVRGTLEFVFSVHPSSAGRAEGSEQAQKQGASITHEAVAVATKLLSSVPASMTADDWFRGISSQLFGLFDGEGGADLARTAAQMVGYGILGKKQYGAPGSPGWNVFVQPMLERINPSLRTEIKTEDDESDVIDLSANKVLVDATALQQSLQRLQLLVLSNPSPGLCKRLLGRVVLQIWALAAWKNVDDATEKAFCGPAKRLLQTYLRLFGKADSVMPIINNLTCKGSAKDAKAGWTYTLVKSGSVQITPVPPHDASAQGGNWAEIEERAGTLADFMSTYCSAEDLSSIFLSLLRRWVEGSGSQRDGIELLPAKQSSSTPEEDLAEVTVLQKMMEKTPEKLVGHFDQLLDLITQVFEADAKSPLGDEVVGIILSLLNLAVTAPSFQKSDINPKELKIVEEALDRISQQNRPDVSATARNLFMLLKYRDELDDPDEDKSTAPSARKVEDRKTHSLAMNYIAGDKDNPPPIVSEGLKLLSGLIVAESPILDITATTVLLSNLLKDNEDYINLQVVRMFTQLANKHPKSTVKELLDNYLDPQEKASTDTRLRFGEALLQVIERLGETFAGDAAQHTGETLLSIAGRRGYRPKTLAKQQRDEKLRTLKEAKKAKAGQGGAEEADDEDMADAEDLDEEELAKNDILAQIIQGWESQRGSEDVRMRTSALSIFGSAMESNIRGMGPSVVSAGVDLCLNVLTLEPELEKAILRRAAIVVILGFVKALDEARQAGRTLGFGLTEESRVDIQRSLEYVAATDNDGLVQQHARDVVESLENWRMASLIPTGVASEAAAGSIGSAGLTSLAGLAVNPATTAQGPNNGSSRPRIEEVE